MMRLKCTLSFDGTPFSGFQVQKNAVSIQGALCEAFATVCRAEVPVCGCSRTDAGVHAREFVCHADVPDNTALASLGRSLNALLPRAISVSSIEQVPHDFHARYSAKEKTYRYYIWNHTAHAPLLEHRVLHFPAPLDVAVMQEEARALLGTHDFRALMGSGGDREDTVRTMSEAIVTKEDALVCLEVRANGFLYHMVRNIAGTLLELGSGKSALPMQEILASENRENAGFCAPPDGLYLWRVHY